MTTQQIILTIALALVVNEILGGTHRLSRCIVRWAARCWEKRSGIDHTADWLEDLEHGPPTIFKLLSALWLALSAIVPPERLTLNLPSVWRMAKPSVFILADVFRAFSRLAVTISFRGWAKQRQLPSELVHPAHQWFVLAVASLLGRDKRDRFAEELMAELAAIPGDRARARFVTSLVLGAPRTVIMLRFAKTPPR
ncbi:hypothetical protein LDL08_25100 [Nonomuraea glycinis]|uniref:Uncharacterized protein n=1 Tax=Nonomuraea glycinis TaxID=2047744 RepID=A0A918E5S1_9ACTN|nr:hypothetical protein [Nonomuraea glycinis]MCA2179470.1 hypothetical protein [Nonomuraea glycinis]GGP09668.1 hypothetical protein GCM10012278_46050 [Nonomuraea glycinis]